MHQQNVHSHLLVQLADGTTREATADEVISEALALLNARYARGTSVGSPADCKAFVCARLGTLEHEVFAVMFLDAQLRVIEFREMFSGTLTQTSVYPREVVKAALAMNAAAVVLVHNHPSGVAEPSRADEFLTERLKSALGFIDVRVLDHLIVGGGGATSMAERGML